VAKSRKLLFVRHSAVEIRPDVPSSQWKLSTDGRSRCYQLIPRIKEYRPAIFITSQENKAKETGQIMADAMGVPWRTAENLHEHDRQGAPYLKSEVEFKQAIIDLFSQPEQLVFGRETAVQAFERFDKAVANILSTFEERNRTGDIAIVTHGTVITLFVCHHNPGLDPVSFWRRLSLPDLVVLSLVDFSLSQ